MEVSQPERPTKSLMDVFIDDWDDTNIAYGFDESRRISTGWWDESNSHPQVTVTPVTEDFSYDAMGGGGSPTSWVPALMDVNVWVAFDDDVLGGLNPLDVEFELLREVLRIVAKNATGTQSPSNETEFNRIEPGVSSFQVHTDEAPTTIQRTLPVEATWRYVG